MANASGDEDDVPPSVDLYAVLGALAGPRGVAPSPAASFVFSGHPPRSRPPAPVSSPRPVSSPQPHPPRAGVERDASSAAIKKAYRALALKHHPDKNRGGDLADARAHKDKFQEISASYAILSDAKKRKYYDETGDAEDVDVSAEDFVKQFQEMMGEMLGGGSIADVFEGLDEDDLRNMPPFPFPEALFPPGTFPPGVVFSEDFHVPPAVQELLESGGPDALAALLEAGAGGPGGPRGGRRRGFGFGGTKTKTKRRARGTPGHSDSDSDADSYSDSSDGDWESASDSEEGGRPGGGEGGEDRDHLAASDEDLAELDAMMSSLDPRFFEEMMREDAARGGDSAAGAEARALMEMLEEMKALGAEADLERTLRETLAEAEGLGLGRGFGPGPGPGARGGGAGEAEGGGGRAAADRAGRVGANSDAGAAAAGGAGGGGPRGRPARGPGGAEEEEEEEEEEGGKAGRGGGDRRHPRGREPREEQTQAREASKRATRRRRGRRRRLRRRRTTPPRGSRSPR